MRWIGWTGAAARGRLRGKHRKPGAHGSDRGVVGIINQQCLSARNANAAQCAPASTSSEIAKGARCDSGRKAKRLHCRKHSAGIQRHMAPRRGQVQRKLLSAKRNFRDATFR